MTVSKKVIEAGIKALNGDWSSEEEQVMAIWAAMNQRRSELALADYRNKSVYTEHCDFCEFETKRLHHFIEGVVLCPQCSETLNRDHPEL